MTVTPLSLHLLRSFSRISDRELPAVEKRRSRKPDFGVRVNKGLKVEGAEALCKLLSKKEVHYKMLSSVVWLPAKPLLSSLQLRAF